MSNVIRYRGTNTNRLRSPNIWHDFPADSIRYGTVDGIHFFDDFIGLNTPVITTEEGEYYFAGDTGGTCTKVADTDYGQMVLTTDGTDEDGIALVRGNAAGEEVVVLTAAGRRLLEESDKLCRALVKHGYCAGVGGVLSPSEVLKCIPKEE